jgi:rubrerythrin
MEPVCYTLEGALEKAIEEEKQSLKVYREAMKKVENPHARAILKDLAKEELEHRNVLEKALLGETLAHLDPEEAAGSSMELTYFLEERKLDENSTAQDVMIYAIHEEKRSADFYQQMANHCKGAPMGELFLKLHQQEMTHLTRLEETYEKLYMTHM